jgi:hypothetical protein
MSDKTKEALAKLDPENDNHWTTDGSPRRDTVRMLAGNPALTREDIVKADQTLTRQSLREARAAEAARVAEEQEALKKAKEQENVNAVGDVTGVPPAPADATAPGALVGTDGSTANPSADSDNQGADSDRMTSFLEEVKKDQAKLAAIIAEGESHLGQLMNKRERLTAEIADVTSKLDALKGQLESNKEPDHRANMATIQGYLASQQAKRDERAAAALQDATGRLRVPRSEKEPIDQKLELRKRDGAGAANALRHPPADK